METTDDVVPLMDNAQFLEQLGSLETFSQEEPCDFPEPGVKPTPRPVVVPIAAVLRPAAERRGQGPQFMMPAYKPTAIAEAARPSAMRVALAVVGFALMMSIGAAAAALVFHDRIAQIVALW